MLSYIPDDDGYTESTSIRAVKGLHDEVKFTFRPTPLEERVTIMDAMQDLDTMQSEAVMSEKIARQIVSWDIKKKGGAVLEITGDNVMRLKSPLYQRLARIVFYNTDGGDTHAESKPETASISASDRLLEIESKSKHKTTKAEADRKN